VKKFGNERAKGFDLIYKDFALNVVFKTWEGYLDPGRWVKVGTPILRVTDKHLTEYGRGIYKDYQLRITAVAADWSRAYPLTFENLLRDEKGKIIYISQ
jgi:hypothetical protein